MDTKPTFSELLDTAQGILKSVYGPNSHYTTTYSQYERGYWGQIPNWMGEFLSGHTNTQILDIGPGWGGLSCFTKLLVPCDIIAIERKFYLTPLVTRLLDLSLINGDVERQAELLWLCAKFGCVIFTEVIEHLNFHPQPTLEMVHEIMLPGGRLYVSTPDANSSWGKAPGQKDLDEAPKFDSKVHSFDNPAWVDAHTHIYTTVELKGLLVACGFKIRRESSTNNSWGRHIQIEAEA